ncbi:MAG: helix-turn-helix domain-containing protein [Sphingorhabdus sp.]
MTGQVEGLAKTVNNRALQARTRYITPAQIEVAQFAPAPEFAPYITQFYHFFCNEPRMRDAQPAALGHIVFYVRGHGTLQFHDGSICHSSPASLFGPCMAHAEFDIEGPFEDFGLALSPLGFVALTGKPATAYADRMVDAAELFGQGITDLATEFQQARKAGTMTVREMVERTTAFLQPFIRTVSKDHIALIQLVGNWLSSEFDPNVETLFAQIDKSRSTATRLIRHYFGASPKQLMRKYRAVRAATVLVDPDATPEMRARVESLFYDQPHMIREIRHFTGRTPGALDSDDTKILRIWLSKDNYQQLDAYPG